MSSDSLNRHSAQSDALVSLVADLTDTDGLLTGGGQELRYRLGETLALWTPEDTTPYAVRAVLPVVADVLRAYLPPPCVRGRGSTSTENDATLVGPDGFTPLALESVENARRAEQAERRAEDAEAAIEATRDLLDGWEHDGPDDPAVHLLIQRVWEMLAQRP